jgi:hypothetical protein
VIFDSLIGMHTAHAWIWLMFSRESSLAGVIRDQMQMFGLKSAPGRSLP